MTDKELQTTTEVAPNKSETTETTAPKKRISRPRRTATKKTYSRSEGSKGLKKDVAGKEINGKEALEAKIDWFFEANKELGIRKLVSTSKLLEANTQIGNYKKLWNPKMKPYINMVKTRAAFHTIDLLKTMVFLDRVYNFLRDITKDGGKVLLVGTRGDIIKEHIRNEADRAKAFYVNQRWLGGTLTNFKTISKSIDKLNNLIALQGSDGIKKYSKKEQLEIQKYIDKRTKFLGGLRTMRSLPQALIVTDPVIEHNAIDEARQLKIPVIAIANTNADPSKIDFIIPANSRSIKAVYLIVSILCDAIAEGNGDPTTVIGKKDEEIILPEVPKKAQASLVSHKHFGKNAPAVELTETPVEKVSE